MSWSYIFIVLGAVLWGIIGLFVQHLGAVGFTPLQIVAIRVVTAAIILVIYLLLTDRSFLRIKPSDSKYFFATGILSVVFFNWCYFTAIQETSLSVAVVLLYTAPLFVAIISRFLFNERLTRRKILALGLIILGSSLVVGFLPSTKTTISTFGLLVGLGSGLGYALYSIFGKLASYKYAPITIITYTFLFASAVMIPFAGLWDTRDLFLQGNVLIYSFGLGLVPTVLAYLCYTVGLSRVDPSKAAVLATIEPVAAMLVGIIVYGERLTAWQTFGSMLIILAVVLVQEREVKQQVGY